MISKTIRKHCILHNVFNCILRNGFTILLIFIFSCESTNIDSLTNIESLEVPIKVKKNTLSLSRHFKSRVPNLSQKEKSKRAKRLLSKELIQPQATRELTHSLKSIKNLISKIEEMIGNGENPAFEIKYLQAKYESLKDLDKKVRNNFRIRQVSQNPGALKPVRDGAKNLLPRYKKTIKPIFNYLEDILTRKTTTYKNSKIKEIRIKANFLASIRELGRYLEENVIFEPQKPEEVPSKLPLRSSDFKKIEPNTKGEIKPAYLRQRSQKRVTSPPINGLQKSTTTLSSESAVQSQSDIDIASVAPPATEDLEETIDVVVTQDMRDLVASFNNSPARIYEWVKNNIEVEFYYGSLKGSLGTFLERAGNDTDISSLLLALYRAANIPCRYITGTIDIPVDKAKSLTGIDYAENIGTLFASAGIPATSFTSGDEIVFFRVEHTWTEAFVDYDPYAGAKSGEGDTWVPLSPWYKFYDYQDDMDLLTVAGFDTDTFLDDQISEIKKESPSELFKMFFEDYLKENDPGHNWQDGLRTRTLNKERFRTLPNTENFTVVSYNGEYSELPDSVRHKVTVAIPEVGLSHTFNVCEIVAKKLTYSYPPADQASEDLINGSGGIENVHPLSVTLLPSLKLEGVTVATGSVVNAGYYHTLQTTFIVPLQGSQSVGYSVTSGAYYALGIDPQFVSNKYLVDRIADYISTVGDVVETTDNMDAITGEALYLAVMKYLNDCYIGDRVFASMQKNVFLKQTSGTITGKNLTVWVDMFGNPTDLEDGGFFVDSPYNVYTPISTTGDHSRELDFMLLSGYNNSYHEHDLFEHFFNLDAISTMKLLSIASEQGMPIYDIDSSNIGSILPILGLSNDDKSAIQSAVNQGQVVKVHQDPLTVGNWSGAGYIKRDPADNSAGYMISGGWAGGNTTGNGNGTAGGPGQGPTAGDPVNIANGNLFHTDEDISVPAIGMPITIKRYYNSMVDYNGPFGFGWTYTYNEYIIEDSIEETLTYAAGDGGVFVYTKNPDGTYKGPPGMFSSLTKNAAGFELREKSGTRHVFDVAGKLISIVDRNSNTITFSYTGDNLTAITDPAGRSFILSYNMDNKIESIIAPGDNMWLYSYDGDDLAAITNNAGQIISYTYYSDHKMASRTNAVGGTVIYDYYSNGKTHMNVLPNGGTFVFSYNTPLTVTTVTDPDGNSIVHYYNDSGVTTGLLDPLGYEEIYMYDEYLNRIKTVDKNGGITKNTYDGNGNLLSTTDPLNHTTTYTIEPVFNQVASVTDPLGNIVTNTYDANGNLLSTVDAEGILSEYTYYPNGLKQTYSRSGQLKSTFTYHSDGNLATVEDAEGHTKMLTFDALGRQTGETDGNGNNVAWVRNAAGNIIYSTDAEDRESQFTYNALNLRTGMTDAENRTTIYEYNSWGRLTRVVDPMGLESIYTYTLNYKLLSVTDKNGQTTTYSYDPLGRVTQKAYGADQVETFAYDPVGNLVQVVDTNGVITRTYDELNRLTEQDDAKGQTIGYTYDAVGNLTVMIDPLGNETQYSYLRNRRLAAITDPEGQQTEYVYQNHLLQKMIYPNGTESVYTYDLNDRVSSIENRITDGITISTYAYEYDAVGNRTAMTDASGMQTYQYDRSYQLTRVDYPDGAFNEYAYDDAGNRVTINMSGILKNYTYDDNNRMISAGDETYTYDNNGNRLTKAIGGETIQYAYDPKNQLSSITYSDGSKILYGYNYLGQRTKQTGSEEKYFVYDNNQILLEYDQDGVVGSRYVNGLMGPLYSKNAVDEHTYFLKDVLGSVTQLTDSDGVVQESYTYDVFGAKRSAEVVDDRGVRLAFTGKELESKSGLLDFGARFYDPQAGRFISADLFTWGPDDLRGIENSQVQRVICELSSRVALLANPFAYLINNPVSDVDNDGFVGYWWDLLIIIAAVIVGVMAIIAVIPTIAALTTSITLLAWIGIGIGVVGLLSALIWGGHWDITIAVLGLIVGAIGFFVSSVFWSIALAVIGIALALAGLYLWITADADSGEDKVAWVPHNLVEPGKLEKLHSRGWPKECIAAFRPAQSFGVSC